MANRQVDGKKFMGNMISPYGLEKGFVDYSTLAKSFQKVRKDDILALQAGGWRLASVQRPYGSLRNALSYRQDQ